MILSFSIAAFILWQIAAGIKFYSLYGQLPLEPKIDKATIVIIFPAVIAALILLGPAFFGAYWIKKIRGEE